MDEPPETDRAHVDMAMLNALNAVEGFQEHNEDVDAILHMHVFVNAPPDFTAQSKIADIASCIGNSELRASAAALPSGRPRCPVTHLLRSP